MTNRPNLVLAVVAGLVVALAVIAGLLTATREPPELDPATPEGTVQLFVLAVIDGEDEKVVDYLDPALGCRAPLPEVYRPSRISMAVAESTTTGQTARVVLDVTEQAGGFLDSSTHREVFDLRADGDGWILTGHPWPIFSCK